MNVEWRKEHRISCSIPVLLRFPHGELRESWGVVYDISRDGLKVATRYPARSGQTVYVSFAVGTEYHFENLRTSVRRKTDDDGYCVAGMVFDPPADRRHVHEAIQYLAGRLT